VLVFQSFSTSGNRAHVTDSDRPDVASTDQSARSGLGRKLLLVLALGIIVYLVTQRDDSDRRSSA